MSITYDSNTKILTVDSISSTNIFEDIYQADVANGWNVFQKITDFIYYYKDVQLKIINSNISDAGTTLIIEYNGSTSLYKTFWLVNTTFDFDNCDFVYMNTNTETSNSIDNSNGTFYNCKFQISSYTTSKRNAFYINSTPNDVIFEKCFIDSYFAVGNAKMKDTVMSGKWAFIINPNSNTIFDNLSFYCQTCYALHVPSIELEINGGKFDTKCVALLRNTIKLEVIDATIVNKAIQVFCDNGYEGDFIISYNVDFRLYDENGTQITDKKIKIRDKNGNIVYDGIIGNVKLKEYDYHYVGDGTVHNIMETDYNSYLPYSYEIYDELETYYKGIITSLEPNKIIEITINRETKNIFTEIDNLKTELLKHAARSESLLLSR